MCLLNPKKIELNEPVTTYKVFEVERGPFGPIYHSPYQKHNDHSVWSVGETNEVTEYQDPDDVVRGDGYFTPFRVEYGALHSYADIKSARRTLHWFRLQFPEYKYVIGECRIPEDCDYVYEGNDGGGYDGYASQKLTFLSIIEDGKEES